MKTFISFFLFLAFYHVPTIYTQNWVFLSSSKDDSLFYNKTLLTRSHNIVKVWIRDKYSDPLNNHYFDVKGKVKPCTGILTELEFDLKYKLVKRLSVKLYYHTLIMKITNKNLIGSWEEIQLNSSYDITYSFIKNK